MCSYDENGELIKITGVILAGGKSTRMGREKSLLEINGIKFIDRIISVYRRIFPEIIIVTNTPEKYKDTGIKLYKDIIPGKGSLGGLYTGILEAENEYSFVIACDMPFPDERLIRHITSLKGNDAAIPVINKRYYPLFALYSKSCKEVIENQLRCGNLRISDIFQKLKVKEIKEEEVKAFDKNMLSLVNINTPEEYEDYKIRQNNEII